MIRALNIIALLAAAILAIGLYRAKTEAQDARERVERLQAEIQDERRSVAVLRAEIAYLERPERLRVLARKYLGLNSMDPEQEIDLETALLRLQESGAEEDTPPRDIFLTGGGDE